MSLCHFFVWKYGCVRSEFHKELLNILKIAAGISLVLIEKYLELAKAQHFLIDQTLLICLPHSIWPK